MDFILIKYINTESPKWFYFGMVVFAIGFLNKYNIVFLLLGLFPAVLFTEHRRIFFKKEFYFAMLLALVLILPNLIWQINNDFPVVHHLKELAATQLVNVSRISFFKDQMLFFISALVVILSGLYALMFYPVFKKYKLFFYVLILTLTIFAYLKAKSYYALGLYPIYISFGSVFLSDIYNLGGRNIYNR